MHTYLKGFALVLLLTVSCKQLTSPPENSNAGSIKTGDNLTVATYTIGSGGGSVTVSAPGKPLDGMNITIPSNSYSGSRTINVSYAPVTSHSFGTYFNPISPLITISNGGGYGDSVMLVKIPVTLASGELPIAFFYDDIKGKLEPIPVATFDGSSVTIMTKHFDVSGIAANSAPRKGAQPQSAISDYAKIIVSGLTDQLYAQIVGTTPVINSGYLPNADDWEFVNHGSYLPAARGGHCAGQDLSSLWYFFERKAQTGKNLYHQFDKINNAPDKIWEDNPFGYHCASAVQANLDFDALSVAIYKEYISMQDDYTWKALVVSMLLTKEPYYISIRGLYNGKSVGHALTAYGVNIIDGKILIADPNYPGNLTRKIDYVNGTFSPYFSGLTAEQSNISFTSIKFEAKTALIDWNAIGQTWTDIMDNKHNPGYPAYSLVVNEQSGYPLTDGMKTDLDTLDFSPQWSEAGSNIAFKIYDASGNQISTQSYLYVFRDTIILKPGENTFGVAIFGSTPNNGYKYVDFQWITVTYQSLGIDPQTMSGQPNISYNWNAMVGTAPSNARYEWDFGDQTAKVVKYNDAGVSHTFTQAGNYTITLSLYDNSKNQLIGTTTATATIGGLWNLLYKENGFQIYFQSTFNYNDGSHQFTSWTLPEGASYAPIVWKDTGFTATVMYRSPYSNSLYFDSEICVIKATFLSDGITLKSMTINDRILKVDYRSSGVYQQTDERIRSFTVTNAVAAIYDPTGQYLPPYIWASDIGTMVSNVADKETIVYYPDTGSPTTTVKTLTSVSWDKSDLESDALHFMFSKN